MGGAVPVTVFLFLIAAVYSRSGSISYVTFFQISNIVFAFLGLVAGGVLAYFAGRYFEPYVIEILNKRTRIVDPTYQRTEFLQPFLTRLQSNRADSGFHSEKYCRNHFLRQDPWAKQREIYTM